MNPAPSAVPGATDLAGPQRPRAGLRWLLWLLVLAACGLMLLLAAGAVLGALQLLPIHITFNGEPVDGRLVIEGLSANHQAALGAAALVLLLAALLVVPLALLGALAAAVAALLFGFGVPVLVLGSVLALLASPLLLLVWLVRRARRPAPGAKA